MRKKKTRGVVFTDAIRLAYGLAYLSGLGAMAWYDFGTVDRMRNADLKDQCKAQLTQIGKALEAYVKDNGGKFPSMPLYPLKEYPPSRLKLLSVDSPPNLLQLLRSKIRDDEIFVCPSAPDALQQWDLTFIWNEALNGQSRASLTPAQLSATWMVADIEALFTAIPRDHLTFNQMTSDMVPAPHVRGYNILYADGKVRWSSMPPRIRVTNLPKLPMGSGVPGGIGGPPGSGGRGSGSGS